MLFQPWAGEQDAARDEEQSRRHEKEDEEKPLSFRHVKS